MSNKLNPVNRTELIRRLKRLGFGGPFSGGKHEFMIRDKLRLTIPNPHQSDVGVSLLSRLLKEAGIAREEWEESA